MKITRRALRRIIKEALDVPRWPENHFAWRSAAFTRDEELRYILDVADPETVQATIDIGKPVPPGANVLVVMGAYPNSEEMWMHDSELLDLIEKEGWYERPPPKGADPAGFWDGKGEWQDPDHDLGLPPDIDLPPATEYLNEIKTVPSKWWEYEPDEVMADIYWQRRQIPPTDPEERELQWQSIKSQLEKKYPPPKGLAGETYEKTLEDYKNNPGWFN